VDAVDGEGTTDMICQEGEKMCVQTMLHVSIEVSSNAYFLCV
jgi:hypothetical protein